MGAKKNQLKIDAALAARQAAHKGPGGKLPGSRNKKNVQTVGKRLRLLKESKFLILLYNTALKVNE